MYVLYLRYRHGNESWSQKKLESLGYPAVKPHDPAVINFDAIPECDGQTDGHVAYGNSLPDAVANSSRTNQFRNKLLDKHWSKQEMMYDYKAELAGILTRSNT